MLLLAFSLCWVPTHLKTLAEPPALPASVVVPSVAGPADGDCYDPSGVSVVQRGLWDYLGWSGYT